jgi:uncharacterized damage-inducible protein DinB
MPFPEDSMDARATLRDMIWRLLDRDLDAMQQEVSAYPDDASLWHTPTGIVNSGGTLALHLAGNLRHFIGATLGGSGYVRDREHEFAARGLSRAMVNAELADAQRQVTAALIALDPSRLDDQFPLPVMDTHLPTHAFLLHLCTHLTYHLGQVDYHRRLTTASGVTVKTISVPALVAPLPE